MNRAGVPWEKCSASISKDWVWLGHSCSLPLVSWPLGDFYKVARAETAPTCLPGTKSQHEGSLEGAGCDVPKGPHPTPHALEPEPHGTSACRCHPFRGADSRRICPDTSRPARSISPGRTSYLVGLCSSSCNTTIAQPSCWPGGVVAAAAPARKRVAAGSPCAPESGQDLAL